MTTNSLISINSDHRDLTSDSSFRCNKPEVGPSTGCTDAEEELYEGPAYCGIILNSNGPFAACHPKVNPNVSKIKSVNAFEFECLIEQQIFKDLNPVCIGLLQRLLV